MADTAKVKVNKQQKKQQGLDKKHDGGSTPTKATTKAERRAKQVSIYV